MLSTTGKLEEGRESREEIREMKGKRDEGKERQRRDGYVSNLNRTKCRIIMTESDQNVYNHRDSRGHRVIECWREGKQYIDNTQQ